MRRACTSLSGDTRVIASIVVAASVVVQLWPGLRAVLIFDRDAVALHGEFWRILTASVVHFSWMHLAGDAAVLVPACWLLHDWRAKEGLALLAGASIAGTLFVMLWSPELRWYGGLSAIAHAVVAYGALITLGRRGGMRVLAGTVLAVLAIKLGVDSTSARRLSAVEQGPPVLVATMSHIGAVVFACLLFGIVHLMRTRSGTGGAISLDEQRRTRNEERTPTRDVEGPDCRTRNEEVETGITSTRNEGLRAIGLSFLVSCQQLVGSYFSRLVSGSSTPYGPRRTQP